MNIRIAIIAACVSTLALPQIDVALANYGAASVSKNSVSSADNGPGPAVRRIIGTQYTFTRTGSCGSFSKNCKPGDKVGRASRGANGSTAGAHGKATGVINGTDLLLSKGKK